MDEEHKMTDESQSADVEREYTVVWSTTVEALGPKEAAEASRQNVTNGLETAKVWEIPKTLDSEAAMYEVDPDGTVTELWRD